MTHSYFPYLPLVLLGAFAVCACAQDQSNPAPTDRQNTRAIQRIVANWNRMDSDKDGKISSDESRGVLQRNFSRIDTNQDRLLDQNELQALAQRNQQRNANRNRTPMTDAELLKKAPPGVTVVADIAYREGHPAWKLDLAYPSNKSDQRRPALVFIHGGGWRGGDKRAANFIDPTLEFAAKGYVCISVNYRFLTEVPMMDCIADVKCAVRWLRAHADQYQIDPERIGAYGNSAGAHLAAMLALCPPSAGLEGGGPWQDYSSMVQAVVCSATPTSWLMPMSNRQRGANQVNRREDQARRPTNANRGADPRPNSPSALSEELRRKISPITYVHAAAPPFLLVHEKSDNTVSVRHSDKFAEAMRKVGVKDITYLRYEDGSGHGAWGANISETGPAREAFFERTLRDQN